MRGSNSTDKKSTKRRHGEEWDQYDHPCELVAIRIIFVLLLVGLAAGLGTYSYVLLNDQETALARKQYHDSCVIVQETLNSQLNKMLDTGKLIAESYIYKYMGENMWPNATLEGFEMFEYMEANARAVSFNPIVYDEDRTSWEQYANENYNKWHHATLQDENLLTGADNTWRLCNGIYETDDTSSSSSSSGRKSSSRQRIYVPIWQIAPLQDNFRAINYDLFSEIKRHAALEHVIHDGNATLTAFVHLVQDSSIGKDRPSSILFYPVMADFDLNRINGTTSVVFSWDDLLKNVLPSFVTGIQIVVKTTGENQHLSPNDHWTYTLKVSNGNAVTLGRADLHDEIYDNDVFVVTTQFDPLQTHSEDLVTYHIELYPSKELYDSYKTIAPIIACIITASMVIATSLIFVVYDFLYKQRIDSLAHTASISASVLNSFFPKFTRERLFGTNEPRSVSASILSFLRNKSKQDEQTDISGDAIAQNFQLGTVLFADIAGFTSWATNRPPKDVFHFLEKLYQEFDKACKKNKVFKVETIGDCYMCVTGIPDEDPEQVQNMTEFACSMQKIFIDTQNQLLPSLGDSLRALDIRIGFHCGKVTAGVLRSEKGRFQLFGDTVNVAARFEQNGIPGMIQVSEDVKNELIRYGLDTWLVERPEGIHAKGLGQLKAFWIVPEKVVGYDTIEIARTREEFKETS